MPATEVKGVTHRAERLRSREFIKIFNKTQSVGVDRALEFLNNNSRSC